MTALDVNGTTTIRKSLDMTANRIINIASPVAGTDAVPMNYITGKITAISSSTTRVWGEGRPGATVLNSAGQCSNTISGRTIKISKSKFAAAWDKTAAACPTNWWVCTAEERDLNGATTAGYGKCPASGAIISSIVGCQRSNGNPLTNDNLYVPPANATGVPYDVVWVADVGATAHVGKAASAVVGDAKDSLICMVAPVWCCAY
ncbi:MAG: hypothetical protein Q7R63_01330 [bacterium]|nr:hypothetical protein [bacterium]